MLAELNLFVQILEEVEVVGLNLVEEDLEEAEVVGLNLFVEDLEEVVEVVGLILFV